MSEIWCSGEKVGTWNGSSEVKVGDEVPVTLDGDKYNATVNRVYKRHNEHCAPTDIIEIEDPRPMPIA